MTSFIARPEKDKQWSTAARSATQTLPKIAKKRKKIREGSKMPLSRILLHRLD
jgi:hypothetical protein